MCEHEIGGDVPVVLFGFMLRRLKTLPADSSGTDVDVSPRTLHVTTASSFEILSYVFIVQHKGPQARVCGPVCVSLYFNLVSHGLHREAHGSRPHLIRCRPWGWQGRREAVVDSDCVLTLLMYLAEYVFFLRGYEYSFS